MLSKPTQTKQTITLPRQWHFPKKRNEICVEDFFIIPFKKQASTSPTQDFSPETDQESEESTEDSEGFYKNAYKALVRRGRRIIEILMDCDLLEMQILIAEYLKPNDEWRTTTLPFSEVENVRVLNKFKTKVKDLCGVFKYKGLAIFAPLLQLHVRPQIQYIFAVGSEEVDDISIHSFILITNQTDFGQERDRLTLLFWVVVFWVIKRLLPQAENLEPISKETAALLYWLTQVTRMSEKTLKQYLKPKKRQQLLETCEDIYQGLSDKAEEVILDRYFQEVLKAIEPKYEFPIQEDCQNPQDFQEEETNYSTNGFASNEGQLGLFSNSSTSQQRSPNIFDFPNDFHQDNMNYVPAVIGNQQQTEINHGQQFPHLPWEFLPEILEGTHSLNMNEEDQSFFAPSFNHYEYEDSYQVGLEDINSLHTQNEGEMYFGANFLNW